MGLISLATLMADDADEACTTREIEVTSLRALAGEAREDLTVRVFLK